MKISATIITFNEASNIERAVRSLNFADEIIVVDSESTDATREIAESLGAKVLVQKWLGFGEQKQFAVEHAAHEWIFSLDADEEVSPELQAEIALLKSSAPSADGFRIPRLTKYMNRWIRHGGWYPDWQMRFYDRRKGFWKKEIVHESVQMKEGAKIARTKGEIFHYSIENAAYHHRSIGERYAPLAAEKMFVNGRRTNFWRILTAYPVTFLQIYLIKGGFLDGIAGLSIASFSAHHAFLKHITLYEMQNKLISPPQNYK